LIGSPPCFEDDRQDEGAEGSCQVGRGLVSTLFRQPRVPGDVEEADRRRTAQPAEQAGLLQRPFDVFDECPAPSVFLLTVVDRHGGSFSQLRHTRPEIRLGLQRRPLRHARFEERLHDLRPPPVRLCLGDPAKTVPAHTEPPLDDDGAEPIRELELDRLDDGPFLLSDVIFRSWLREAGGLPDDLQDLQGDARSFAQLAKGRLGDAGEPIERGDIEKGEREASLSHRPGDPVERHAGLFQAPRPPRRADIR
jgi:hypothetical protein